MRHRRKRRRSRVAAKFRTIYRDAGDGFFVSKAYAESHPKTTVKERCHVAKAK